MTENRRAFQNRNKFADHPAKELSRYRYHTGATLRSLEPEEACPVLFRDIGPEAMAGFLRGTLSRLAGPFSPITYMRTADYEEPYLDHGHIGRLVFLAPQELTPWHSGVETIYVAHASQMASPKTLGFVPAEISLSEAAERLADVANIHQLKETLGPAFYRDAIAETRDRLDRLNTEHQETERVAEPLRRNLQSANPQVRETAREHMQQHGLTETDLCTAWHHLPSERRSELGEIFRSLKTSIRV